MVFSSAVLNKLRKLIKSSVLILCLTSLKALTLVDKAWRRYYIELLKVKAFEGNSSVDVETSVDNGLLTIEGYLASGH